MQFSTPINIQNPPFRLKHSDKTFLIGSCFADNIAQTLKEGGMQVCNNPFGTLYNPSSILACFERLLSEQPFSDEELVENDSMYHSMLHHGSFSSADKSKVLSAINKSIELGHKALIEADVLIITFGTAWVYEYNGKIVANCHKMSDNHFVRRRLSVAEIAEQWRKFLNIPLIANKKIIFTVSPIRHIKDGLHENQLSKATLLLTIEQLTTPQIVYFPSYEIMMDELRDYRFYAEDMLHPSDTAIRYIQEQFINTFFEQQDKNSIAECMSFYKQKRHRPLHPDSKDALSFQEKLNKIEDTLKQKYPYFESYTD